MAAGSESNSQHGALGWASIPDALIYSCHVGQPNGWVPWEAQRKIERKKVRQSKIKRKTKFTECNAEEEKLQHSMHGP